MNGCARVGILLVLTSVSGCAWLYEVPENYVPPPKSREDNLRANATEARGQVLDASRAPRDTDAAEDDRWNPVSRPIIPPPKPFKFESASGDPIANPPPVETLDQPRGL